MYANITYMKRWWQEIIRLSACPP